MYARYTYDPYTLNTASTVASFYIRYAVDLIYIFLLTSQQIFNEHEWSYVSYVTCYTYQIYSLIWSVCCLHLPIDTVKYNNYICITTFIHISS